MIVKLTGSPIHLGSQPSSRCLSRGVPTALPIRFKGTVRSYPIKSLSFDKPETFLLSKARLAFPKLRLRGSYATRKKARLHRRAFFRNQRWRGLAAGLTGLPAASVPPLFALLGSDVLARPVASRLWPVVRF